MGVNYKTNASLALDVNLVLFVIDTDVSSERGVAQTRVRRKSRSCSDPHLKWNVELLRPAFEVEHKVS